MLKNKYLNQLLTHKISKKTVTDKNNIHSRHRKWLVSGSTAAAATADTFLIWSMCVFPLALSENPVQSQAASSFPKHATLCR